MDGTARLQAIRLEPMVHMYRLDEAIGMAPRPPHSPNPLTFRGLGRNHCLPHTCIQAKPLTYGLPDCLMQQLAVEEVGGHEQLERHLRVHREVRHLARGVGVPDLFHMTNRFKGLVYVHIYIYIHVCVFYFLRMIC